MRLEGVRRVAGLISTLKSEEARHGGKAVLKICSKFTGEHISVKYRRIIHIWMIYWSGGNDCK